MYNSTLYDTKVMSFLGLENKITNKYFHTYREISKSHHSLKDDPLKFF